MIGSIIWIIIVGFVAGLVARWLSPGPNNPQGFILTAVLGIVGAFLATWIGQAIGWYRADQGAGFIAAIVGGFNQIRGAIAGGLLIGVVDNLAAAYVSTQYRAAVPLLLLIAIILFRPQGILGRAEERTV